MPSRQVHPGHRIMIFAMTKADELRRLAPDHPVFHERRDAPPRPKPKQEPLAKVLPFQRVKPR